MLKKIAIVLLVLVLGVLGYAATRPGALHVERSLVINAPAEQIFPVINDFHQWRNWSPYETRDPEMKKTYSGSVSGEGAVYEWDGNSQVGKGRMEITGASAPSRVTIKLDFMAPLEGHDVAEFTLAPQGTGTLVTWKMDGPQPYVGKLIGVFINMDTMIGTDFETGLRALKKSSESSRP